MNDKEKRKRRKHVSALLRRLFAEVKRDVLARVYAIPDDWDGFEMREYIASAFRLPEESGERHRRYRETCEAVRQAPARIVTPRLKVYSSARDEVTGRVLVTVAVPTPHAHPKTDDEAAAALAYILAVLEEVL